MWKLSNSYSCFKLKPFIARKNTSHLVRNEFHLISTLLILKIAKYFGFLSQYVPTRCRLWKSLLRKSLQVVLAIITVYKNPFAMPLTLRFQLKPAVKKTRFCGDSSCKKKLLQNSRAKKMQKGLFFEHLWSCIYGRLWA